MINKVNVGVVGQPSLEDLKLGQLVWVLVCDSPGTKINPIRGKVIGKGYTNLKYPVKILTSQFEINTHPSFLLLRKKEQ